VALEDIICTYLNWDDYAGGVGIVVAWSGMAVMTMAVVTMG
jgi:hypothetical protein